MHPESTRRPDPEEVTVRPHPDDLMPHLDLEALVDERLVEIPPVEVLPGARSHFRLRYAVVQGWRPLELDLHLPLGADAGTGPHPVVVYVHGGSFLAGVPTMGPWTTLPALGVAVASVSYRLSGEAPFPAAAEDVRAALAWLTGNAGRFGLDLDRLALWGSSAGGYLAALVALTHGRPLGRRSDRTTQSPPQVGAVVAHYPVSSPADLRADATLSSDAEDDALAAVMAQFFDGSAGAVPTSLADHLAALGSVDGVPPFLVLHGDADRRVDLRQSRRLVAALEDRDVPASLVVVPGADHGAEVFASAPLVQEVLDFLAVAWSRRAAAADDRP